jgi:hypothetical protein
MTSSSRRSPVLFSAALLSRRLLLLKKTTRAKLGATAVNGRTHRRRLAGVGSATALPPSAVDAQIDETIVIAA